MGGQATANEAVSQALCVVQKNTAMKVCWTRNFCSNHVLQSHLHLVYDTHFCAFICCLSGGVLQFRRGSGQQCVLHRRGAEDLFLLGASPRDCEFLSRHYLVCFTVVPSYKTLTPSIPPL